jgi:hypothetical protein
MGLIAAGAVLGCAGVASELYARHLTSEIIPPTPAVQAESTRSTANSYKIMAVTAFAVGGIAVLGGVTIAMWRETRGVSLAALPSDGGGMFLVRGRL